jgi:hypothetical protein
MRRDGRPAALRPHRYAGTGRVAVQLQREKSDPARTASLLASPASPWRGVLRVPAVAAAPLEEWNAMSRSEQRKAGRVTIAVRIGSHADRTPVLWEPDRRVAERDPERQLRDHRELQQSVKSHRVAKIITPMLSTSVRSQTVLAGAVARRTRRDDQRQRRRAGRTLAARRDRRAASTTAARGSADRHVPASIDPSAAPPYRCGHGSTTVQRGPAMRVVLRRAPRRTRSAVARSEAQEAFLHPSETTPSSTCQGGGQLHHGDRRITSVARP